MAVGLRWLGARADVSLDGAGRDDPVGVWLTGGRMARVAQLGQASLQEAEGLREDGGGWVGGGGGGGSGGR